MFTFRVEIVLMDGTREIVPFVSRRPNAEAAHDAAIRHGMRRVGRREWDWVRIVFCSHCDERNAEIRRAWLARNSV